MYMEESYSKAIEDIAIVNPAVVAANSGAIYEHNYFQLRFFSRSFIIHYPSGQIQENGVNEPPPLWQQIIILHYLLHAKAIPIADSWINYRDLPGASLFEMRFRKMAIDPLLKVYGNNANSLKEAGTILGGMQITRTGDAAFRFMALPRLPVACILYLGEEEIPPSVNILFDASASSYLPTEDLSYVGMYLSIALIKTKPK